MRKFLLSLLLASMFMGAKSQTFSWIGNEPILDFQTDSIPILVSGLPNIIDTNFGLVHICMDIYHTYDNDLVIKIVSPNGDSINLIQGTGGSGDNFIGTCVGVDGTFFSNTTAPYSGLFQPVENTASLNNGQNPNGIWYLIVRDVAAADTGHITNASIEFTNNPPQLNLMGGGGGPTGIYVCATCVCPNNAASCDLLPDMISSAKEIELFHTESPGAVNISNATPNIGYGPLEIYAIDTCYCGTTQVPCGTTCPNGDDIKNVIRQRIYQKVPGNDTLTFYDVTAGLMTYHATHGHLHVDNFVSYTLRKATSNPDATTWPVIATGSKQSFCLINLGTCAGNSGQCLDANGNIIGTIPNQNLGFHTGCGLTQGIYVGNYDVYSLSLNDPIVLDNVCNGDYYIVSITDPSNNFIESDETNNWVAVPITLTQQNATLAITPNGPTSFCAGDSVILTANSAANYLWSTGDTTQSIVVYNSGTYSFSADCGAGITTSPTIAVNVISSNTTPTVAISITQGSNPSCPNIATTFTANATNEGANPIYQWEIDGANVGTNSPTFTSSSIANNQVVTCELTSSLSCLTSTNATSNAITMNVGTILCYCVPVYGTTASSGCLDGDVIARLQINTLDNLSGTGCPGGISGYSDYSSSTNPLHTTSLNAGGTYTCTVTTGQYAEGYKAWIDFNDDGIFSTNESIGNTTVAVPGSGSVGVIGNSANFPIIIPCNISTGNHRLRVRCLYNNSGVNIDPCIYQNDYGEVEDYTITILPPVGCSQPSAQMASNISSTTAQLSWTPGCNETLWDVHITNPGDGAPSGIASNPNVTNPINISSLTPSTTYEYWVAANCTSSGNGFSAWTGPFLFTTFSNCSAMPGTSLANPIIIGPAPCVSFPYNSSQINTTANCFTNNYSGTANQPSPDVWYQFTVSTASMIKVSTCSSSFDTYLHLLNSAGTQIASNDDNGPDCTGLTASILSNLGIGTYYIVAEGYGTNTGPISLLINSVDTCSNTILNLNCFIEGYYDGAGAMVPTLNNQGLSSSMILTDSVTIELHAASVPYPTIMSTKSILQTDGSVACTFNNIAPGKFFVVIKHRSSMETWSSTPIIITSTGTYDFTTSASKAYGDNLVQLNTNLFGIYTGDVNQDGAIDVFDFLDWDYDSQNFTSGYVASDYNGDGNVDVFDFLIWDPNSKNFINVSTP